MEYNMSNKALCFVSDTNYFPQTKHAIESAKKHNPEYKIVLLSNGVKSDLVDINVTPSELGLDPSWWIITGRTKIVKHTLQNLGFDSCILIDGDTYTYNSYTEIQKQLDNASVLVIPHLLKPLPNDNLHPQIRMISLMGNYNSGIFAVSKSGMNFLNWWDTQTSIFPQISPQEGVAAEQGWLRFALDFDENAKVFRNPSYNVAYWNIKQRTLEKKNDSWYIDGEKLTIMHFSGLKKETPVSQMSVHQNRYILSQKEPAYEIFDAYKKLVWG